MPTKRVGTPRFSWTLTTSGRRQVAQLASSTDAGGASVRSQV
ncbi:hypothetical protein [Rothia nasimurium]|nr:hypothetical protein [Rothia nasimurium]